MESLFKMKYWDYSNQKFQLHGRICLTSSLFWGVLSVALTEYIHPPIEQWILRINPAVLIAVTCISTCIMLVDTIVSAKAALDLAKVLEHLSVVRDEIERLRLQLDELKENAQEHTELIRKRLNELSEQREAEISHLGFFKFHLLKGHPSSYSKKFNTTLHELKERIYNKKG